MDIMQFVIFQISILTLCLWATTFTVLLGFSHFFPPRGENLQPGVGSFPDLTLKARSGGGEVWYFTPLQRLKGPRVGYFLSLPDFW